MENHLNSSAKFSQDFRHCWFFRKIQDDLGERNIESETFTDRYTPEGKMGFYSRSNSNGGTIQRYRSSITQEYQCFESWNPEKEE